MQFRARWIIALLFLARIVLSPCAAGESVVVDLPPVHMEQHPSIEQVSFLCPESSESEELVVCGLYEQQMWFGAGTHFPGEAPHHQFTSELRARSHDIAFMGFVASVQRIR